MYFNERLWELRMAFCETRAELAEATDMNITDISSYENGKAIPRGDRLVRLAKHFGVTVEDLVRDGFNRRERRKNGKTSV